MRYEIDYSAEAERDIDWFERRLKALLREAVAQQLRFEPTTVTRNRKPHRRTAAIPADWELRVGDYRVFYDVDEEAGIVGIVNLGYKLRETLYVAGNRVEDRDDTPTEEQP